ncbi:unnamed protein product [Phytomonas sp. Hart1]|nr:unnamed protein product [Phytomonas sp. Hart1]|eukprot:CCW68437.1 unnamed protein product [Phytomonas sp. isolate Hart1]
MSFPIIRLFKTSLQNASLTDDPSNTHATLYTFLRSVPSEAEVALAMSEFEKALHATDSLLHRPNIQSVMLLESAIQNFLLREPPYVNSTWNSQSDAQWKASMESLHNPPSARVTDADQPPLGSSNGSHFPEPPGHAPFGVDTEHHPHLHVPMAAIKAYQDPFEGYNAHYQATSSAHLPDSPPGAITPVPSDAAPGEREDDAPAPDTDGGLWEDPGKGAEVSGWGTPTPLTASLSHHPVTLEKALEARRSVSYDTSPTPSRSVSCERSLFPLGSQTGLSDYHPLLEALIQQVRGVLTANDDGTANRMDPCFDRKDLDFHKTMLDIFSHIRDRLRKAGEEVEQAAEKYRESVSIWDPSHAYYKESLRVVQQLSEQARAAEDLYTVERSEQETIRIAYCALYAEVITMRLLMRDVKQFIEESATAVSQGRFDDDPDEAQTEQQLVDELRDALFLDSTVEENVE